MTRGKRQPEEPATSPPGEVEPAPEPGFRVEDRRHWTSPQNAASAESSPNEVRVPALVDEYRRRAEEAESQLQDYIEAFKRFKSEQEEVRVRLARDVERKVELGFGQLVAELLETADNLELALEHAQQTPQAEALIEGVSLARKRFLDILEARGVVAFRPHGAAFDPAEAEAMRVDRVDEPERHGVVTEVLRPGYRLGERVLRPARVAVGRHDAA